MVSPFPTNRAAYPKNYNREIGVSICRERLRDKLWMLYGFMLKNELGKGGEQ